MGGWRTELKWGSHQTLMTECMNWMKKHPLYTVIQQFYEWEVRYTIWFQIHDRHWTRRISHYRNFSRILRFSSVRIVIHFLCSQSPSRSNSSSTVGCLSYQTSGFMSLLWLHVKCSVVFISIFSLFVLSVPYPPEHTCLPGTLALLFSRADVPSLLPLFLPFPLTTETVRWPRWHHLNCATQRLPFIMPRALSSFNAASLRGVVNDLCSTWRWIAVALLA